MPHDLAHEEKQNQAIRELAGAVASLAGKMGAPDVVKIVARVQEILSDDEAVLAEVAPVEAPKAELHVTPPASAVEAAPVEPSHEEHADHEASPVADEPKHDDE